ncbi:MAG: DNA-3-methyladenine glycosylase [Candidatus Yonathbacteria bacterium]|nr:DNA-3-methyladenine glycosylase [Candidatus Yonathbacteria bacterium]
MCGIVVCKNQACYDNTVNTADKRSVLGREFFERDTHIVARELLGMTLVRRYRGTERRAMITETESYDGPEDKASHASRGKTARNAPMFGEAGQWYVYLCYGVHEMLNIVTGPEGYPAAVLIRGIAGYDGPGKLTKVLDIGRSLNGKIAGEESGLWIEKGDFVPGHAVLRLPRIGVAYAGAEWAGKLYRFRLVSDESASLHSAHDTK